MNELTTDHWALLLPEEWVAEQDEETIVITDDDEVSVIEISELFVAADSSKQELLSELATHKTFTTTLAELEATYQEFEDEDMYWREWFLETDECIIAISHGCDIDNKGFDDASVDEILSTLALKLPTES